MSWLKNIGSAIGGVLAIVGAIFIVVWLCDLAAGWMS